ncbi:hypothetical protein HELRODRAFT_178670 [Helobdella robusta]|uniref:Uncharacterized protein n=1 Tax=Helobdella robusta TaxID=6412 RepID=T1FDJ5_HELRO|nr:hypothetical protein HELRODRAFT_178670 [Helobdella robusta]ESN96870.1 hypothetical protein HELRODRAFT_178670 [Helobdella robusta]
MDKSSKRVNTIAYRQKDCGSLNSTNPNDIQAVVLNESSANKTFANLALVDENIAASDAAKSEDSNNTDINFIVEVSSPSSSSCDDKQLISVNRGKRMFIPLKKFKLSKLWRQHRYNVNDDGSDDLLLIEAELMKSVDELSIICNRSILNRVMWFIFMLLALSLATYQIKERIMYYLTYPTSTDFDIVFSDGILPQVTICNNNNFKRSSAETQDLIEYFRLSASPGRLEFLNNTEHTKIRKFLSPGLEQLIAIVKFLVT